MTPAATVVKVGGSLLNLHGLGARLRSWLDIQSTRDIILVVGGGAATDLIRRTDQRYGLGPETSHWLANRAMSFNSHLLAEILPRSRVVNSLELCAEVWQDDATPILDVFELLRADESHPDRLPHSWDVTSDSIAARVAVLAGATQLILLKSRAPESGKSWMELAEDGYVDPYFARAAEKVSSVRAVNFRQLP